MSTNSTFSYLLLAVCLAFPLDAQSGGGLQGSDQDDAKTASGLKQALQLGTERAVDLTGRTDGFFKNAAIKILMPEKLRMAEKGMRMAGMGPKIDEFVLSMNRAAEKAAPAARSIFKDAVMKMTFDDARKVLTGGNMAATEYFRAKTSDKLIQAFRPPVESAMEETGVVSQYNQVAGNMPSLPFGRGQSFDITDYVVNKTLDGIFFMLGQEEKKIRTEPAAQVTPLLKQVFGKH